MNPIRSSAPNVPADSSPDPWDALMAQHWLTPPEDFTQRVLNALPSAAAPAPHWLQAPWHSGLTPRTWRDGVSALALVVAGAAGLGEVLAFLAGLWLAAGAAG